MERYGVEFPEVRKNIICSCRYAAKRLATSVDDERSGRSTRKKLPNNWSGESVSSIAPPSTKWAGASMCVPVCVPIESLDTRKPSLLMAPHSDISRGGSVYSPDEKGIKVESRGLVRSMIIMNQTFSLPAYALLYSAKIIEKTARPWVAERRSVE